jgi:toxin ParE1/3/4
VLSLVASLDALRDHPNLGKPGRLTGTRELVVGGTPYVVPYRGLGDDVEILAVFHGARRWPDGFE